MTTIVLATDLTEASAAAVVWSVDLARRLVARILVVHVLDQGRLSGLGRHERVDQARSEREPLLMDLVRTIRAEGVDAEFLLWSGAAADGIADAAASEAAEFIVLGTRSRRSAERMLLGSVSGRLIRSSRLPVMVVPADTGAGRPSGQPTTEASAVRMVAAQPADAVARWARDEYDP